MRRHGEGVFRFAYLKVGDPQTAEDIAQETFVRAYRALDRFDTGRDLRPWLLSIAANLSRNELRNRSRYLAAVRKWVAERWTARPAAGDQVTAAEEGDALWQEIKALPAEDQDVIYLRYFMELGVEETAQVLGVAAGTVKSRSHRALGRLRGRLLLHHSGMYEHRDPGDG